MYHIQFIRSYARKKQRLYRKIGMVFKLYADRIVIGFQYSKTKSSLHLCPFHGLNPHVCQVAIRVDIGEHVKVNLVLVRFQRIFKLGHVNVFGQRIAFRQISAHASKGKIVNERKLFPLTAFPVLHPM